MSLGVEAEYLSAVQYNIIDNYIIDNPYSSVLTVVYFDNEEMAKKFDDDKWNIRKNFIDNPENFIFNSSAELGKCKGIGDSGIATVQCVMSNVFIQVDTSASTVDEVPSESN